MILQPCPGGLLVFRQTDHALLSCAFADAWGNEEFPAYPHRDRVLVAAARHDDGWAEWELAPRLGDAGEPVDFIRVPVSEHVAIFRRGIDLVEQEDAYAGCLASLHGERLYTRPFRPGMQPRIENLTGDALDEARAYVGHERVRQQRLISALAHAAGVHPDQTASDLDEAWRLLQVWDRLSLFVCMQPLGSGATADLPPVRARGADTTITVRTISPGRIEVDPYPFTRPGAEFELTVYRVHGERWSDEAAYRRAWRSAKTRTLAFTAVPR